MVLTYNSFNKWNKFINTNKTYLTKWFNFYFLFYFFSLFSKFKIFQFLKCKKKLVILKSPFHYKLFKHHLMYQYFNIKCVFFVNSKYSHFLKFIFSNFIIHNKIIKISIYNNYNLKLKNLFL